MDWLDFKEFIKDSFVYIIIFIVTLLIVLYVFSLTQVLGSSMQPTLDNRDITVVLKIHYRLFSVKRFDVVSFNYNDKNHLVKRVIGLPGEHIKYENGRLYIDDKLVEEDFMTEGEILFFDLQNLGYEQIPENHYFVLGDNRDNSLDSRTIGLVEKSNINGKIVMRLFPFHKIQLVR